MMDEMNRITKIIIGCAIEVLNPIHTAQGLTYLKFSNTKVGLLINFNVLKLKDGIKRLIARDF